MSYGAAEQDPTMNKRKGKHIAVLTRTFSMGGAERVAANVASALANAGYSVDGICLNASIINYPISEQVNVLGPKREAAKPLGVLSRLLLLRKILHSDLYDMVIDFSLSYRYVNILGIRKDLKYVVSERNYPLGHYSENQFRQVGRLYQRADLVVFQTAEEANCFSDLDSSKVRIIPNAVLSNKAPAAIKKDDTFITAARLCGQKNLPMMIEAFRLFAENHPGYQLKIFGDGDDKGSLLGLIQQMGLAGSVLVLPYSRNIHDEMLRARAFLSTSYYEGIQNSLLEALSMGVPCVATDCLGGGAKMLLSEVAPNWLVRVGDSEAMAQEMNNIVSDYASALKQAQTGSKYVAERFDPTIIYSTWVNMVDSLWGDEPNA